MSEYYLTNIIIILYKDLKQLWFTIVYLLIKIKYDIIEINRFSSFVYHVAYKITRNNYVDNN